MIHMSTKIAKMQLKTYGSYRKDLANEIAIVPKDFSDILPGYTFPSNALTALHGHNNGTGIAGASIMAAKEAGLATNMFEFFITSKRWTIQLIGIHETPNSPALKDVNVLRLDRCRKDVRAIVSFYWTEFIKTIDLDDSAKGMLIEQDPMFATQRPDFIGFLHARPEFDHLDAITYRVRTPYGLISMASVFSKSCLSEITIAFGQSAKGAIFPAF
jgi:hypothetical protein